MTSMLVIAGAVAIWIGAAVATTVGAAAMATLPTGPVVAVPAPGTPAEATLPTTPALEPDWRPFPMPVEPTTPWGATAGPCRPPYGLPTAATVAGRVALGLGVTPNVSPRCTGA